MSSWAALVGLHLVLLGAAATFDRASWPSPIGDEATYAMQAESLAFDGDLLYSRHDFERYVGNWGHPPVGLILQSGDHGATVTFGKPLFYAVYLAPFVRLAPRHGAFVANAVLLLLASVAAAHTLRRPLGALAPLWVAVAVFASITFVFVFWVHADLFLLSLLALALALLVGGGEGRGVRWLAAGGLIAVLAFSRPFYAGLVLPAVVMARRPRAVAAILVGALAVALAAGGVHQALAGSWTGYGASRAGFYPHTGYPDVDFPAETWTDRLASTFGNQAWRPENVTRKPIVPSLWAWNGLYFLLGRHVGVVPYFLPAFAGLLLFLARPRDRFRWALLAAVALAIAAFFWWRPFNFYGGGGTIGNRYLLPLVSAFWFLPTRRLRLWPLVVVPLVVAPFLQELWRHPRAYPIGDDGVYRYVTAAARRLLPYETTQSHLQLAGREDVYAGVFLRFLSTGLASVGAPADGLLQAPANDWQEILLGSGDGLRQIEIVVTGDGVQPEVAGHRVERLAPEPGDDAEGARFALELDRPSARHPLWWTWQPVELWVLRLRFGSSSQEPVRFRLRPMPARSAPPP